MRYQSFFYQLASWKQARRVVAKVEFHHGKLFPRVGFIVTNLSAPNQIDVLLSIRAQLKALALARYGCCKKTQQPPRLPSPATKRARAIIMCGCQVGGSKNYLIAGQNRCGKMPRALPTQPQRRASSSQTPRRG
jgi:hypothetical protein